MYITLARRIAIAKEMSKYREILKSWEAPFTKSQNQAWEELQFKLEAAETKSAKVIKFNPKSLISVAAAAAVIIAVIIFWPKSNLIQLETVSLNTETFLLPDSSEVILNAGSVITYDDDWSKERTLQLEGQAFFKVKKGSKFTVVSDLGLVEVMGTSFDVFARDTRFKVECRTGKVKVSLKSGKGNVLITPGNSTELLDKKLVISTFDLAKGDWQVGEFVFTEEPLKNVFDELSRQFGVKINAQIAGDRFYTGRFNNEELNNALELVCLPMSLKFEIKGENQVFITEISR